MLINGTLKHCMKCLNMFLSLLLETLHTLSNERREFPALLDFKTMSSKRHELLKTNNKLFSKYKFTAHAKWAISRCLRPCIDSTKGWKPKVNYSIDHQSDHDGMS